jgi:hypothetical protein
MQVRNDRFGKNVEIHIYDSDKVDENGNLGTTGTDAYSLVAYNKDAVRLAKFLDVARDGKEISAIYYYDDEIGGIQKNAVSQLITRYVTFAQGENLNNPPTPETSPRLRVIGKALAVIHSRGTPAMKRGIEDVPERDGLRAYIMKLVKSPIEELYEAKTDKSAEPDTGPAKIIKKFAGRRTRVRKTKIRKHKYGRTRR